MERTVKSNLEQARQGIGARCVSASWSQLACDGLYAWWRPLQWRFQLETSSVANAAKVEARLGGNVCGQYTAQIVRQQLEGLATDFTASA